MERQAALLFGSETLPRVIALLSEQPGHPLTAAEIIRQLGRLNRDSLYRAINRGLALGVIARTTHGRTSTYQINTESPIYPELKNLLGKLLGITGALRSALGALRPPKIDQAFIFGSFAQNRDSYESDIDVFVIGDVSTFDLSKVLQNVLSEYHREINPVIYSRQKVETQLAAGDPFLREVWSQPKIFLVGEQSSLPDVQAQPAPYFMQEMGAGGYSNVYAGFVVGAVPVATTELTEHDQEIVEEWFRSVNDRATPRRANNQVDWWQVDSADAISAEWQGWLYPGPVISVRQVAELEKSENGAILGLTAVVNRWSALIRTVRPVLKNLGVTEARVGVTLNTYGPNENIVDLSFRGLKEPTRGAPPGPVPPWSYQSQTFSVEHVPRGFLADAVRSLLRHFNYRRLEPTLQSLEVFDTKNPS